MNYSWWRLSNQTLLFGSPLLPNFNEQEIWMQDSRSHMLHSDFSCSSLWVKRHFNLASWGFGGRMGRKRVCPHRKVGNYCYMINRSFLQTSIFCIRATFSHAVGIEWHFSEDKAFNTVIKGEKEKKTIEDQQMVGWIAKFLCEKIPQTGKKLKSILNFCVLLLCSVRTFKKKFW